MRVLHVINGLTTGGAEAVLFRLATYPSDIEHEVVCLERRDWYSSLLEARGVSVRHLNCQSIASTIFAPIRLYKIISRSRPDVVQAWMYRSNIIASLAGKLAGIPVIWNIRCSFVESLRLRSRLLAYAGGFLARGLASTIINCSAASRQLHAPLGYDAVPGVVIPNGYDPGAFAPDEKSRELTRREFNISDGSFLLGSIGRWDPQKGYPILLRALRILMERGIALNLLLVGRGLDLANPELAKLVDESGCAGMVHLIGQRSDVADIARALDVHVLASLSEGFPNVIAESMLAETPNVATNVGDAGLIVAATGWLIPPGDAAALADAIEQAYREWSTDPARWRKRRSEARQRIVSNFSLGRVFGAYKQVWENVANVSALKELAPDAARPASARRISAPASETPVRVLHIINSLVLGGAETLLYRLVSRGTPQDHIVVSLAGPGWYSDALQDRGFEVHHLGIESVLDAAAAVPKLKRIIKGSGAHVVQCWMYRSNVFGGVIAKSVGKPVVWGIHCASLTSLRPTSRGLVRLSGVLARWTPNSVVLCSREAAAFHKKLGYGAAACQIIHNGYDPAVFYPDEVVRAETRRKLGMANTDFLIGTISRWDPLKDIPNFIAALRRVHEQGVPFRCVLVGAGLGPANAALAAELRRADCLHMVQPIGPRDDIQDVARALDLHVLASLSEAFPNVVAETMLSGTPNVVTNVGDSALMVGTTGWLVPPANPEQLAEAIISAFHEYRSSPMGWAARQKAARQQIASKFSLDEMTLAYGKVWRAFNKSRLESKE